MSADTNLQSLWQRQPAPPPLPPADLLGRVTGIKKKAGRKLAVTNVLLLATCFYIGYVTYSFHPKMLTTTLGCGLVISAMILYVLAYNSIIPLLRKANPGASVQQYLEQLLKLKQKQDFLFRTMLTLYFFMLSAGMFLYFIEVAAGMSRVATAITYGATTTWVLAAWFYLRPRTIRKQQKDLLETIQKLEKLCRQLEA